MSQTNNHRQAIQREDEAYRLAAHRLHPGATVSPSTTVYRTAAQDGAFVEITVWIPRSEMVRDRALQE